jgi:hypothetical protein
VPLFKRVPRRDHNHDAEAAMRVIERGVYNLNLAADRAFDKHEKHVALRETALQAADRHGNKAAAVLDDHWSIAALADSVMEALPTYADED